jgi:hypothetical protein
LPGSREKEIQFVATGVADDIVDPILSQTIVDDDRSPVFHAVSIEVFLQYRFTPISSLKGRNVVGRLREPKTGHLAGYQCREIRRLLSLCGTPDDDKAHDD